MNPLNTLLAGKELTVDKSDGTSEEVKVIQFGVNLCQKYASIVQSADEAREIEFLCQKPEGWAASLKPASQEEILNTGNELNADFFARWLGRRSSREKLLPKPDMGQMVQMLEVLQKSNPALLESLMKQATSPILSPKSPAPAA